MTETFRQTDKLKPNLIKIQKLIKTNQKRPQSETYTVHRFSERTMRELVSTEQIKHSNNLALENEV